MAVDLILIRHGESEANVGLSDDPDCALTELGLEQARRLAHQLTEYDLRGFAALTSPYRRARQTAAEIEAITGLPFTVEEAVREWGAAATIDGRHYPVESGEELILRLEDFLRRYEGRKLVITSHAAPIGVLLALARGERPEVSWQLWEGIGNCCLRRVSTIP